MMGLQQIVAVNRKAARKSAKEKGKAIPHWDGDHLSDFDIIEVVEPQPDKAA